MQEFARLLGETKDIEERLEQSKTRTPAFNELYVKTKKLRLLLEKVKENGY